MKNDENFAYICWCECSFDVRSVLAVDTTAHRYQILPRLVGTFLPSRSLLLLLFICEHCFEEFSCEFENLFMLMVLLLPFLLLLLLLFNGIIFHIKYRKKKYLWGNAWVVVGG